MTEHVTKRFGRAATLNDVNLDIPVGREHALLGENGTGKRTRVNCLSGVFTPTGQGDRA